MNRYLLDTDVVSELRKRRPHAGGSLGSANSREEQIAFVSRDHGRIASWN